MTRAIRIHEPGAPDVMRWEEVEVGPPGAGEARVEHTRVGLNFIDTYHRSGLYPLPLPAILGVEAAGVVTGVGEGVTDVQSGDRVAYAGVGPGAYSEARVLPAAGLVPIPEDVSDEVAAAVLLKGMTTEYLIRRCFPVKSGMTVLLQAAAGGVGLLASQWLKSLGARVLGTVGSDEKAEIARAHGCDEPIVYTREDVAARVRELTGGEGVPVVFDSVGKATWDSSLASLRRRGTLVSFGNASGAVDPIPPLTLAKHGSLFLTRPTLKDYTQTRDELLETAHAVFDVVRSGAVKVQVGQRFALADARAAHEALEARRTTGSTVLVVDD